MRLCHYFSVMFNIFFDDVFEFLLFIDFLFFSIDKHIIEEFESTMHDVLILFEQTFLQRFDGNIKFSYVVGSEVNQTQQGLEYYKFMLTILYCVDEHVAD